MEHSVTLAPASARRYSPAAAVHAALRLRQIRRVLRSAFPMSGRIPLTPEVLQLQTAGVGMPRICMPGMSSARRCLIRAVQSACLDGGGSIAIKWSLTIDCSHPQSALAVTTWGAGGRADQHQPGLGDGADRASG